jgi:hypothetical protein
MNLFDDQTQQNPQGDQPPVIDTPAKVVQHCEYCGTEHSRNGKYCSKSCGNMASLARKVGKANPQLNGTPTVVATLTDMPSHAQYVIARQEREINDLRDEKKRLLDKLDAAEQKVRDLDRKIMEDQHQQALNGIESKKPDFFDRLQAFFPENVRGQLGEVIISKFKGAGQIGSSQSGRPC